MYEMEFYLLINSINDIILLENQASVFMHIIDIRYY